MIHAVVPAKGPPGAKSRLRRDFSPAMVEQLAAAMLADVLDALCRVPALARVVVATPHADVAEVARRAGAEALVRDDTGLNAAVEAAAADLCEQPEDGVLVVLGDVAGASPEEIEELLGALNGPGVALAPARDGGTSALLRVPRDIITAGFGPNSAEVHRQRAKSAGAHFVAVPLVSLAIDVDQREDLEALLAGPSPAPHTRAVWREHAASNRP